MSSPSQRRPFRLIVVAVSAFALAACSDKAAKSNVIHDNTASRKKALLVRVVAGKK